MTKTFRAVFLVVFILSTIIGCGLLALTFGFGTSSAPVTAPPEPSPSPVESGNFAIIGSLATSLASLIGFITTTVITWRKEKRDSSMARIERKKLELEIEKNRIELEELKKKKK